MIKHFRVTIWLHATVSDKLFDQPDQPPEPNQPYAAENSNEGRNANHLERGKAEESE